MDGQECPLGKVNYLLYEILEEGKYCCSSLYKLKVTGLSNPRPNPSSVLGLGRITPFDYTT